MWKFWVVLLLTFLVEPSVTDARDLINLEALRKAESWHRRPLRLTPNNANPNVASIKIAPPDLSQMEQIIDRDRTELTYRDLRTWHMLVVLDPTDERGIRPRLERRPTHRVASDYLRAQYPMAQKGVISQTIARARRMGYLSD
jgi:hypothetical protein